MNLCLTSVNFYLFWFFLDILVSRCLTGGVTHELVFDISINSCESPDSGNVTIIVEGTVSQLTIGTVNSLLLKFWQQKQHKNNHEINK